MQILLENSHHLTSKQENGLFGFSAAVSNDVKQSFLRPVVVIIMTVKPTSNGIQLLSFKLVFF